MHIIIFCNCHGLQEGPRKVEDLNTILTHDGNFLKPLYNGLLKTKVSLTSSNCFIHHNLNDPECGICAEHLLARMKYMYPAYVGGDWERRSTTFTYYNYMQMKVVCIEFVP